MAGRDWNMALRLARLPEPQQIQRRAATLFTLADRFYNTRRQIPASYTELRDAYLALGIAVGRHPGAWQRFLIEWRADRADRGLATGLWAAPRTAALGRRARRVARTGHQLPAERELDAREDVERFSEYVEEFDGQVRLIQKHYKVAAVGRGWPSTDIIAKQAVPGRRTNWAEIIELGRRRVAERRRDAA